LPAAGLEAPTVTVACHACLPVAALMGVAGDLDRVQGALRVQGV